MIQILADECLNGKLVSALQDDGHEIIWIRETHREYVCLKGRNKKGQISNLKKEPKEDINPRIMSINLAKKGENFSYSGHQIYVGLDVHKKSWSVCIYINSRLYKSFSQDPDVKILYRYLCRNFPEGGYHCAYEAGFSGFWIYEQLSALGVNCLVVHPADIPTTDKERRQKRDASDARKIARALANGTLEGIDCPTKSEQSFRALVRVRLSLQRDITRYKNRIKMYLQFFGLSIPSNLESRSWNKKFIQWLEDLEFEDRSAKLALGLWINNLKIQQSQLQQLDKELSKLGKTQAWESRIRLLKSIPGVGQVGALILLSEIRRIERFKTLDHLASYVGLVPSIRASGEQEHVGNMTRRGNAHLRFILIEAAWRAISKDSQLRLSYERLTKRMKAQQAIVRIARKLLSRIRFVLKNQVQYQIQ